MNLLSKPDGYPIYAVVENVRSLFNVGAIFRSADGINASGVYLTGVYGMSPAQGDQSRGVGRRRGRTLAL